MKIWVKNVNTIVYVYSFFNNPTTTSLRVISGKLAMIAVAAVADSRSFIHTDITSIIIYQWAVRVRSRSSRTRTRANTFFAGTRRRGEWSDGDRGNMSRRSTVSGGEWMSEREVRESKTMSERGLGRSEQDLLRSLATPSAGKRGVRLLLKQYNTIRGFPS